MLIIKNYKTDDINIDCTHDLDGKTYQYKFYSLSAIIAVGYRTNSERALQFRQWN
ncbi:MAG TPA: RhuM family protein [Victivallales bacterium]|nr:RhuM family protein [Victivallales bacterium]HRR28886.1 RhuM family protein [Victivallales bacterium]